MPPSPKFAVFGDVHANFDALNRVLEDAAEQGCTQFACLGDLVTDGGNAHGCIEVVRNLNCPAVKGNVDDHTWKGGPEYLWLRQLKLVEQAGDFTIVHATLDQPEGWGYITNEFDAMSSMSCQLTPVCFHGHTHVPGFWVNDGKTVKPGALPELRIEPGRKYLINPGSVGQPRDGDPRASYAVYDTGQQLVTIRRLGYRHL